MICCTIFIIKYSNDNCSYLMIIFFFFCVVKKKKEKINGEGEGEEKGEGEGEEKKREKIRVSALLEAKVGLIFFVCLWVFFLKIN